MNAQVDQACMAVCSGHQQSSGQLYMVRSRMQKRPTYAISAATGGTATPTDVCMAVKPCVLVQNVA